MSGTEPLIELPPGVEVAPRPPTDGSCPGCGANSERFEPVLGGKEVCMKCGHDREIGADG